MDQGCAVVPPGGFRFFQRLPNGSMKLFVGTDQPDLVRQATKFRLDNGIEVGDIKSEVATGISLPSHRANLPDQRSLRERVTGWKSNRAYQALAFVDQEVANKRASVCVDCRFNQVKYADDCAECFSSTARDLYAMRQARSTDQDPWLGACQIAGHDNTTAVHLDQAALLHRRNFEAELRENKPDCWMLQLDTEQPTELG